MGATRNQNDRPDALPYQTVRRETCQGDYRGLVCHQWLMLRLVRASPLLYNPQRWFRRIGFGNNITNLMNEKQEKRTLWFKSNLICGNYIIQFDGGPLLNWNLISPSRQ